MEKITLYHKCSVIGALSLFEEFVEDACICSSSEENSHQLFWRDVVVVMDTAKKNIVAEHCFDIDSRGQTPYDEIRVAFPTKKEFMESVKAIIVDGKQLRTIKAGKFCGPDPVPGKISNRFFDGRDNQKADSLAIKDFFENSPCEVLNLSAAKRKNKNWNREFLNL